MNINELNRQFESAQAGEILRWAIETYKPRIGLTSSFGSQSAVLLHMATRLWPEIPVFFVDTGFLFKETYDYAESLRKKLHLNLKTLTPSKEAVAEVEQRLKNKSEKCCDDIKIQGMKRALEGLQAWISGIRRDQSVLRKNAKIVEEYTSGLVKINAILNWTSKDVYGYMKSNNLPFHPLWEKGYVSIGCWPCTRLPTDAKDERSGRWAGLDKTECGIHTFMEKKNQ